MIAIQLLWILGLAYFAAQDDAAQIAANEPIDHKGQWVWRACLATGLAVFLAGSAGSWWMLVGLMVMSAAAFSAAFRFMLNRRRGLHPCYVSPSSWYDWQFIHMMGYQWREADADEHPKKYNGTHSKRFDSMKYRANIHNAGIIAYLAEGLGIALGIYLTTL